MSTARSGRSSRGKSGSSSSTKKSGSGETSSTSSSASGTAKKKKTKWNEGDRASILDGALSGKKGTVMFYGEVPKKSVKYLGLELDEPLGKHDGKPGSSSVRFFQCKPDHGYMAPADKFKKLKKKASSSVSSPKSTESSKSNDDSTSSKPTAASSEESKSAVSSSDSSNITDSKISMDQPLADEQPRPSSEESKRDGSDSTDTVSQSISTDVGIEGIDDEAAELAALEAAEASTDALFASKPATSVSEEVLHIHERETSSLKAELRKARAQVLDLGERVIELEELVEAKQFAEQDLLEQIESLREKNELLGVQNELMELEMADLADNTTHNKQEWLGSLDSATADSALIVARNEQLMRAMEELKSGVGKVLTEKEERLTQTELSLKKAEALNEKLSVIPAMKKELNELRLTCANLREELAVRADMDALVEEVSERNLVLESEVFESTEKLTVVTKERDWYVELCDESDLYIAELTLQCKEAEHRSSVLSSDLAKQTELVDKLQDSLLQTKDELSKERSKIEVMNLTGHDEVVSLRRDNQELSNRVIVLSQRMRGLQNLACQGLSASLECELWRWNFADAPEMVAPRTKGDDDEKSGDVKKEHLPSPLKSSRSVNLVTDLDTVMFEFLTHLTSLRLRVDMSYEWIMSSFIDGVSNSPALLSIGDSSSQLLLECSIEIMNEITRHWYWIEWISRSVVCLSVKEMTSLINSHRHRVISSLNSMISVYDLVLSLDASDIKSKTKILDHSVINELTEKVTCVLQEWMVGGTELAPKHSGIGEILRKPKNAASQWRYSLNNNEFKLTDKCDRIDLFELFTRIKLSVTNAIYLYSPRIKLLIRRIKGEIGSTSDEERKTSEDDRQQSPSPLPTAGGRRVLMGMLDKLDEQLHSLQGCLYSCLLDCLPVRVSWSGDHCNLEYILSENATGVEYGSIYKCNALLTKIGADWKDLLGLLEQIDLNSLSLFDRIGKINSALDRHSELRKDSLLSHLDELFLALKPVQLLLERSSNRIVSLSESDPSKGASSMVSSSFLSEVLLNQINEWQNYHWNVLTLDSSDPSASVPFEVHKKSDDTLTPVWFEMAKRVQNELKSNESTRLKVVELQQCVQDLEKQSKLTELESSKVRDKMIVVSKQLIKSEQQVTDLTQFELQNGELKTQVERITSERNELSIALSAAQNRLNELERTVNAYKDQQLRQRGKSTSIGASSSSVMSTHSSVMSVDESGVIGARPASFRSSKSLRGSSSLRTQLFPSHNAGEVGSSVARLTPASNGGTPSRSFVMDTPPRSAHDTPRAVSASMPIITPRERASMRDVSSSILNDGNETDDTESIISDDTTTMERWNLPNLDHEQVMAYIERCSQLETVVRRLRHALHARQQWELRSQLDSVLRVPLPMPQVKKVDVYGRGEKNEEVVRDAADFLGSRYVSIKEEDFGFTDSEDESERGERKSDEIGIADGSGSSSLSSPRTALSRKRSLRRRQMRLERKIQMSEGNGFSEKRRVRAMKRRLSSLWAMPRIVDLTPTTDGGLSSEQRRRSVQMEKNRELVGRSMKLREYQLSVSSMIQQRMENDEDCRRRTLDSEHSRIPGGRKKKSSTDGGSVSFPVAKLKLPHSLSVTNQGKRKLDVKVSDGELAELCRSLVMNQVNY